MKKSIVLMTAAATLTLATSLAFGWTDGDGRTWSNPGAGVVGSKHDMNMLVNKYGTTRDAQGRVCAFCHTPHHKVTDNNEKLTYNPLWSHTINNNVYTPYVSDTFSKTGTADPLAGPSRLCMSCHDGVIAIDQHYGTAGTGDGPAVRGDGFRQIAVGKNDVTNTHPIGFSLKDIKAQFPAINDVLVAPTGNPWKGRDITDLGFGEDKLMTCASCHEVHNKDNVEGPAFLYGRQAGSEFCLMCHNK